MNYAYTNRLSFIADVTFMWMYILEWVKPPASQEELYIDDTFYACGGMWWNETHTRNVKALIHIQHNVFFILTLNHEQHQIYNGKRHPSGGGEQLWQCWSIMTTRTEWLTILESIINCSIGLMQILVYDNGQILSHYYINWCGCGIKWDSLSKQNVYIVTVIDQCKFSA